jgi:transposase
MGSEQRRWRYCADLKAQILAECDTPGASVAKVAISYGINANIVHGCRKLARHGEAAIGGVQRSSCRSHSHQVPVVRANERIEVELRRGALAMNVAWPMNAAVDLADWTRALLQ